MKILKYKILFNKKCYYFLLSASAIDKLVFMISFNIKKNQYCRIPISFLWE